MRLGFLLAVAVLCFAAPARAARIPTGAERAALDGLLRGAIGDKCRSALRRSTALSLIANDRRWGHVQQVCEFTSPPSGAGTTLWSVWAHRSSPSSADWEAIGPRDASRIPPCTGNGGLFTFVPETVVRDLREQCVGSAGARRPAPILTLDVFRDARHQLDDLGPWVMLSSLSDVNQGRVGDFSIDPNGPPLGFGSNPTLATVTNAFGPPRGSGCRAHWPRIALRATACQADRVTKLTLRAPWRLEHDSEDFTHSGAAMAQVGDRVSLARYLDPRLHMLGTHARLNLPRMRVGTADVVVSFVTQRGRITAIAIDIRQERPAARLRGSVPSARAARSPRRACRAVCRSAVLGHPSRSAGACRPCGVAAECDGGGAGEHRDEAQDEDARLSGDDRQVQCGLRRCGLACPPHDCDERRDRRERREDEQ